jgi:poly-gamma-glutamate synthesis protein (capsule biosynthesis protein)
MKSPRIICWLTVLCLVLSACSGKKIELQEDSPSDDPSKNTVQEDALVTFIAAGDNLIHQPIYSDAKEHGNADMEYNFLPVYSHIKSLISEADFACINQETPMAGEKFGYSSYPCFNTPQDLGQALVKTGFNILNIANNHMLDKGADGLKGTVDFLRTLPVTLLGGYLNEEEYNDVSLVEKNGVKIAFLTYTYATNGISLPKSSPYIIPYINDDEIRRQTAHARELADAVIVFMHWGNEYSFKPSEEQRRLSKILAECGVDVVIGMHSHVLQPVEWENQPKGGQTLVYYSLGNFVSCQDNGYNHVGGLGKFTIRKDGSTGKCSVEEPLFLPTVSWFNRSFREFTIYPITEYTTNLASSHGLSRCGANRHLTVNEAKSYLITAIAPVWLPENVREFIEK